MGTVKDSSGGVVPGVRITVTNTATNTRLSTTSDANGATSSRNCRRPTIPCWPKPRASRRSPSTGAGGSGSGDARRSGSRDRQPGRDGRSVGRRHSAGVGQEHPESCGRFPSHQQHAVERPPVSRPGPAHAGRTAGGQGTQGGGFNVAGARSQSNIFLVDGVSNIDTQINSPLNNFRVTDAVQEFAVQTSVATAEFGRGTGGQINIVTKRDTVTDPISRRLLPFWPDPNGAGTLNFVANVSARNSDNTGLVRIDHTFGDKDRLSGRWIEYLGNSFTAGAVPSNGGNANVPRSRSFVINETHTFSPNLLNEFRLGFSRNETDMTVQDKGFNAATIITDAAGKPLPGVVDATQNVENSGLPTVNVSGGFASLGSTNNLPQGRITNTYELFDNMSMAAPFGASRHSWRWGFHIRREDARRFLNGSMRGSFNFSNFADFAAGVINTSTYRSGNTLAYWRRYPIDLYWQDSWKIRENLTLNYV